MFLVLLKDLGAGPSPRSKPLPGASPSGGSLPGLGLEEALLLLTK